MAIITNAPGKIWMALQGRLDQWSETPVHLPNEVYQPSASDSFVIAQHVTTDYGGLIPIDLDCGQPMTGILNLSVMVPVGIAYSSQIGLSGRLIDHFGVSESYSYDDVTVKISRRGRVVGPTVLNHPWNRLETQVYWIAWG